MNDEQFTQVMSAIKALSDDISEIKESQVSIEQRLTGEIRAVRTALMDSFSGTMDSRESVYESLDKRISKIEKVFDTYGSTQ